MTKPKPRRLSKLPFKSDQMRIPGVGEQLEGREVKIEVDENGKVKRYVPRDPVPCPPIDSGVGDQVAEFSVALIEGSINVAIEQWLIDNHMLILRMVEPESLEKQRNIIRRRIAAAITAKVIG